MGLLQVISKYFFKLRDSIYFPLSEQLLYPDGLTKELDVSVAQKYTYASFVGYFMSTELAQNELNFCLINIKKLRKSLAMIIDRKVREPNQEYGEHESPRFNLLLYSVDEVISDLGNILNI